MSSAAHVTSMSLPQRLARSASLVRTRVAPTQHPSSTNPRENEGGSHTADVNEMRISNGSRANQRTSFLSSHPHDIGPLYAPSPTPSPPADQNAPDPPRPRTQARKLAAHVPAMNPTTSLIAHTRHGFHLRQNARSVAAAAHKSYGSGVPPLSFDEGGKWGGGKGKSVVWVPSNAKAGQAKAYGGQAQQQQGQQQRPPPPPTANQRQQFQQQQYQPSTPPPPPPNKPKYANAVAQSTNKRESDDGPRIYCDFAVYKSKAAAKFQVIKPTFEAKADGSRQKKRDGGVLLEMAPAVGPRQYDWNQKQTIMLSPLELVELTESLHFGRGVNFFHDPGMGTNRQGAMTKSLKAEPMPDGSGGIFLNMGVTMGGDGGNGGSRVNMNIAVSFAEFAALRHLSAYLVPRLMGFSEVFGD